MKPPVKRFVSQTSSFNEAVIVCAFFKYVKRLSDEAVDQKLKAFKPRLSIADRVVALSHAKGLFFQPSKADLEWIRKEEALWEAAEAEDWLKFEKDFLT